MRRCKRKEMEQFLKDHAFNGWWYRPLKLRKIHYSDADINLLIQARNAATEAGRKRMVARGRYQYATPQETATMTSDQVAEFERMSGRTLIDGEFKF